MPVLPYPIDGTIYDIDGSTLVSGAIVAALDVTTGEKISTTTNVLGQFQLDLANLTSGYTANDKCQLTASYGTVSGQRSLSRRWTISGAYANNYDASTMVLHSGSDPFGTCDITFASHTNSHSASLYVSYYDRTNDNLVFRIENVTRTTITLPFGYLGKKMAGGFIRIFESETSGRSNTVEVWK